MHIDNSSCYNRWVFLLRLRPRVSGRTVDQDKQLLRITWTKIKKNKAYQVMKCPVNESVQNFNRYIAVNIKQNLEQYSWTYTKIKIKYQK